MLSGPGLAGVVRGQKMCKALNVKHLNFKLYIIYIYIDYLKFQSISISAAWS